MGEDKVVKLDLSKNKVEWEYQGVTLQWNGVMFECVIRGRQRSFASIASAYEAIEKTPKEKRAPFDRIPAIVVGTWTGDEFDRVEITSVAGKDYYGIDVWTSKPSGKAFGSGTERRKMQIKNLAEVSAENEAKVTEVLDLKKQIEALNNRIGKIKDSMARVKLPKGIDVDGAE